MSVKKYSTGEIVGLGAIWGAIFAWLTHIIVCLSYGKWGFLIAGALLPPVGVIHGIGCWFGAW